MTTQIVTQTYQLQDVEKMAGAIAASGLFGLKTKEQAFALMLVAQAEGRHPATVAQEYDVIQGRPAIKSQSALARFQAAGGKIQWTERSDTKCSAIFSHPQGGSQEIAWDIERAKQAGLVEKDNWKKFPAQMLSARVVSEGVRAIFPACLNGLYVSEEVQDFDRIDHREPPEHREAHVVETQPAPTATAEQAKQAMKDAKKEPDESARPAFKGVINNAGIRIGFERVIEVVKSHGYDDPDTVPPSEFRAITNALRELIVEAQDK